MPITTTTNSAARVFRNGSTKDIFPKAPTGRDSIAQGKTLGQRNYNKQALKGRDKIDGMPPLQGFYNFYHFSQGLPWAITFRPVGALRKFFFLLHLFPPLSKNCVSEKSRSS